jgi:hypothetical protein
LGLGLRNLAGGPAVFLDGLVVREVGDLEIIAQGRDEADEDCRLPNGVDGSSIVPILDVNVEVQRVGDFIEFLNRLLTNRGRIPLIILKMAGRVDNLYGNRPAMRDELVMQFQEDVLHEFDLAVNFVNGSTRHLFLLSDSLERWELSPDGYSIGSKAVKASSFSFFLVALVWVKYPPIVNGGFSMDRKKPRRITGAIGAEFSTS